MAVVIIGGLITSTLLTLFLIPARILKRLGAMRREDCHRPALSRFERERPNELWQMDFKGEYVLRGGKNCYPFRLDHSLAPKESPID